jgi:hypothetical protein
MSEARTLLPGNAGDRRIRRPCPNQREHLTPKPVPLLGEFIRAAGLNREVGAGSFAEADPRPIASERTGRASYAAKLDSTNQNAVYADSTGHAQEITGIHCQTRPWQP